MKSHFIAVPLALGLATSAQAGPVKDSVAGVQFNLEHCLDVTLSTLGGEARHVEFESRAGIPTYEFILEAPDGVTYYVGCNALTGLLGDVDVIVDADDERFTSQAQVDERAARETALTRYPGEVEEVKRHLTADGGIGYEVDVETDGGGEFNVWVDAHSGEIYRVDVEYWEIGASGEADVD